MHNSRFSNRLQLKNLQGFGLSVLILLVMIFSSCTKDAPQVEVPQVNIVQPKSFVYLVTLNEEPDLKSLTIVDSLNVKGTMVVPDIPAHASNEFELIIDRVDDSRANISATQPHLNTNIGVDGGGFFTTDSVYIELTIKDFDNRDILTGKR